MSSTRSPEDLSAREASYRVATFILGALTPVSVWVAGQTNDTFARFAPVAFGIAAALSVFLSWRAQEDLKEALEGQTKELAELLSAEQVRARTAMNGLFLPTVATLQKLATWTLDERRAEISGFRAAVTHRARQAVRAIDERAAYFLIEDLTATRRRMTPNQTAAAQSRTDEFTTEFVEGSGDDQDVWVLLDGQEDAVLTHRTPDDRRIYGTYISAPVRAGGVVFGMLTINVLEQGGLSEDDRLAMVVLARMLGAGEAQCLSPQELSKIRQASAARGTL